MTILTAIPKLESCYEAIMPVPILFVDDDQFYVRSFERAHSRLSLKQPIVFAKDGLEALEILRDWVGDRVVASPIVVLLDLHMPRMDGLEFLCEIRSDAALKNIVVFMQTSSTDPAEQMIAHKYHVAGFIAKCPTRESMQRLSEMIDHYTKLVTFPMSNGDTTTTTSDCIGISGNVRG